MPAVDVAAFLQSTDCEAIGSGWLEQPVNAWSSLAFAMVGAGMVVAGATAGATNKRERANRLIFGGLLIATGLGSFLFHGPQPASAQFLHDASFLAALFFLIAANSTGALGMSDRTTVIIVVSGLIVIAAVVGGGAPANTLTAVLAVALVLSDLVLWRHARPRTTWYAVAVTSLVIGLGLFFAGRTTSTLCDPESVFQAHAGWHIAATLFLGAYFLATVPARTEGEIT
jgi:hypothetical protein